jgi:hypothetical protein
MDGRYVMCTSRRGFRCSRLSPATTISLVIAHEVLSREGGPRPNIRALTKCDGRTPSPSIGSARCAIPPPRAAVAHAPAIETLHLALLWRTWSPRCTTSRDATADGGRASRPSPRDTTSHDATADGGRIAPEPACGPRLCSLRARALYDSASAHCEHAPIGRHAPCSCEHAHWPTAPRSGRPLAMDDADAVS